MTAETMTPYPNGPRSGAPPPGDPPVRNRVETDSQRSAWLFVGLLALLIVGTGHLRPEFIDNETSTLLHVKQLIDPQVLDRDWAQRQVRISADWMFELAFYPLVAWLGSFLTALCGRMIAWSVAIFALIRRARTLRIGPWSFLLGFMFWLYVGQSLVAREWIFGGLDSKSFSYTVLLLALCCALNNRLVSCAVLAGIATALHVLAGGWSSMGLLAACAWRSYQEHGAVGALKQSLWFGCLVVLFALPGLLPALRQAPTPSRDTQETLELLVLVHNPFHMDPRAFLPPLKAILLSAYVILTYIFIWDRFARSHAQIMGIFLAVAMVIFVCGLAAREMGAFWLLVYYPFRIGSLYLPLFFSLSAVSFVRTHISMPSTMQNPLTRSAALAACYLILYEASNRDMPERPLKDLKATVQQWHSYVQGNDYSSFADVATWIRTKTDNDAIFISPPWIKEFWLLTERAQVAALKGAPPDARMPEWHQRLVLLLGKPSHIRGIDALKEGQVYYHHLPLKRILVCRDSYGADYYLCQQKRQDLPFPLVYNSNGYYLYKLD